MVDALDDAVDARRWTALRAPPGPPTSRGPGRGRRSGRPAACRRGRAGRGRLGCGGAALAGTPRSCCGRAPRSAGRGGGRDRAGTGRDERGGRSVRSDGADGLARSVRRAPAPGWSPRAPGRRRRRGSCAAKVERVEAAEGVAGQHVRPGDVAAVQQGVQVGRDLRRRPGVRPRARSSRDRRGRRRRPGCPGRRRARSRPSWADACRRPARGRRSGCRSRCSRGAGGARRRRSSCPGIGAPASAAAADGLVAAAERGERQDDQHGCSRRRPAGLRSVRRARTSVQTTVASAAGGHTQQRLERPGSRTPSRRRPLEPHEQGRRAGPRLRLVGRTAARARPAAPTRAPSAQDAHR